MALIVQKFGGTSVGGVDRIEAVADKVLAAREAGDDVVVVLSAMAGETDRLLGLAHAVSTHGRPNPRELDALLATGEQVTITLMCMALEKRGITARSFSGVQAGIRTDDVHTRANILSIDSAALREQIERGRIPVIAGFQGVDEHGSITTLGRGGSDTTAVAVAAALGAEECQIFTDVDGVYTTDPRLVPGARRLDFVPYEEMMELAGQGSKVLQVRSVEFAWRHRVRVRVLSTFDAGGGTVIDDSGMGAARNRVFGMACSRNEALVCINGAPVDVPVSGLLKPLHGSRIDVDMVTRIPSSAGSCDIAFTVGRSDYDQACELLASQFRGQDVVIEGDARVAKVGLIGRGIGSGPGAVQQVRSVLRAAGVSVRQLANSELRISVVIDEIQMENVACALHHEFRLHEEVVS